MKQSILYSNWANRQSHESAHFFKLNSPANSENWTKWLDSVSDSEQAKRVWQGRPEIITGPVSSQIVSTVLNFPLLRQVLNNILLAYIIF